MGLLIKGDDVVTPSNFNIDLSANPLASNNGKGPYLMACESWVDTPDPAAGGWDLFVEYDDPTGATVVLGQGAFVTVLALSIPNYRAVPLFPLSRLSAASNWRIRGVLSGSAGASKVSWRVWLLPQFSGELFTY